MRVLAWRTLREYAEAGHADARNPLKEWFDQSERADWSRFSDVRRPFQSADQVGGKLTFNIGGNKYRLIVQVDYAVRHLWVRWVGTHAEYDRLTKREIENP